MPQPDTLLSSPGELQRGLAAAGYLADDETAAVCYLAAQLAKPLLIEGPPGTGKTQLAKSVAQAGGFPLIRLQCYEGLDEARAIYEWNYRKQLLRISAEQGQPRPGPGAGPAAGWSAVSDEIFTEEFLLERPLLAAIRAPEPVVLLIDEVDRLDIETEALLLEILAEGQVTIPELGTVRAVSTPLIFLTSNGFRDLSEALRRRCLFLYLGYPEPERETQILLTALPGLSAPLAADAVRVAGALRRMELKKPPSVAETLDWAQSLLLWGADRVERAEVLRGLPVLLKYAGDIAAAREHADLAG